MKKMINARAGQLWQGAHRPEGAARSSGFTVIELLVVIVVIAILASLQLPALANARKNTQSVQCLSNQKQVVMAWIMYSDSNRGFFPANRGDMSEASDLTGTYPGWVKGWQDYFNAPANTNLAYLTNLAMGCQLAPYFKSAKIFKCPADTSCSMGATGAPRLRSISMNAAIGCGTERNFAYWLPPSTFLTYTKTTDLTNPSPAALFVTLEEHPDSINEGAFNLKMPVSAMQTAWVDYPAKAHANGCVFSFADGHAEIHRWVHPDYIPEVNYNLIGKNQTYQLNNPDIQWLAKHTSAHKGGNPLPY